MRRPERSVARRAAPDIADALRGVALVVEVGASRFGTPQPRLSVRASRGVSHRRVAAALHLVAALAEVETPASEGWGIEIERRTDESGWVWLDLLDGSVEEAERGAALLHQVARRLRWT